MVKGFVGLRQELVGIIGPIAFTTEHDPFSVKKYLLPIQPDLPPAVALGDAIDHLLPLQNLDLAMLQHGFFQ